MKDATFGWAAVLLVSATLAHAAPREWTSSGGGFKITAELVSFDGRNVKLKKPDGKEITVPLEKLSAADRKFLADAAASPKSGVTGVDTTKPMPMPPGHGGHKSP